MQYLIDLSLSIYFPILNPQLTVFRGHGAHGLVMVRMRVMRMLRTDALVRMRRNVVLRRIELARILDIQLSRRQWHRRRTNSVRAVAQTNAVALTARAAAAAGQAAHAAGGGTTASVRGWSTCSAMSILVGRRRRR